MYIKKLLFIFLLFVTGMVKAQDSCTLRVSLLTCSPGEELYSTFGHSALRLTDPVSGDDLVFNYGTFNFDEPGFYTKFIRGKLLYYVSAENFYSFAESYRQQNRSIVEQVLNLSCQEKQALSSFLQNNLRPENRSYKYDFLFDNCTTRLRDINEKISADSVYYPKIVQQGTKFRELIHIYLDSNSQHWSKLGIDLLLGSRTDAIMSNRQAMFLPDYLLMALDNAKKATTKLVSSKNLLFDVKTPTVKGNFYTHPLFFSKQ